MDTNRLKRFATEARNILIQGVKQRLLALGFTPTGTAIETPQKFEGGATFMGDVVSEDFYNKWMSLHHAVTSRSIKEVLEEAAYTWFNRMMAIRIMSKQGVIAPVLSYENEDVRVPVIVSEARQGRLPVMNEALRTQLYDLLNDDSKTNEQFALLIVAFCHENPIINKCFGAISDYTELLLPQNILSEGGFVDMINHTEFITDEQYASAELIGWLYQFYISDRKDEVFAKKGKYANDEIAPATQIFTPNWIVKYMVENTVGRIYLDNNPYSELKDDMKYLVDQQISDDILEVEDIADMKVADLACGSGHILNECFDLLFKIYQEEGYSRRNAINSILTKNLTGVDIDTRAKQLAQFALLMKACQKDKSFADGSVMPRIYNMPHPISDVIPSDWNNGTTEQFLKEVVPQYMMGNNTNMTNEVVQAILLMNHAESLGSIMKFDISESTRNVIEMRTEEYKEQIQNGDIVSDTITILIPYMNIILALTETYSAICMNPPYMGSGRFDNITSYYVKDNYEEGKADLFSVFMLLAIDRLKQKGKYGMINMQSWMFLSSFEKLRIRLLNENHIDSMLHLGPHTFDELSGEVVQNTAFVVTKAEPTNIGGTYFRLVDGVNCNDKEDIFLAANITSCTTSGVRYCFDNINQKDFEKIPGCTIGYWMSKRLLSHFECDKSLCEVADLRSGISTGDNERFYRFWYECDNAKISRNWEFTPFNSDFKWFKIVRGGSFRKWYGACDNVLNLGNSCYEISNSGLNHRLRTPEYYTKIGITWNRISNSNLGFRIKCKEFNFGENSPCMFLEEMDAFNLLGLLNTNIVNGILKSLNPTLSNQVADLIKLPVLIDNRVNIDNIVKNNISISKQDWDSHETSWDFGTNPLLEESTNLPKTETVFIESYEQNLGILFPEHIRCDANLEARQVEKELNPNLISDCVLSFQNKWTTLFRKLYDNEVEINRQFIKIYELENEIDSNVPLDEITILQQGEVTLDGDDVDGTVLYWHHDVLMKQLISYMVGCWMGRYRLDCPGLHIAHPEPKSEELAPYQYGQDGERFIIDDDAIIPILPKDSPFEDNLANRIDVFVRIVFGSEHLTQNLNFIEQSLGKSITDYVQKDFWKDHKKMYQNKPIYWLFSSKKGAFQCIVYMHRMNPYTAERVRTQYLLPHIEWLQQKENELEENAADLTPTERRKLDSIRKQIEECREYHDRLHIVADQQIAFDLDDGVTVNYAKFGDVLQKIK